MPVEIDPNKRFELHVPVVIVGGGATGLTAALAARDGGAEVLVLERDATPMGSTSMSQGTICACRSKAQEVHGIEDDPDLMVADIMARTDGQADPELARVIAHESGPTVDWLTEAHGVPLELDVNWAGFGHSRKRLHAPPGKIGTELMGYLLQAVERAGADIVTGAHVDTVFADADGRVLGVRFTRRDGATEELGCDALILATCGFGGNRDMVRRFIPEMAEAKYFGWEGNRGEGIEWGMALGAAVADLDAYQGLGLLADPQQVIVNPNFLIEGGFTVNRDGLRFQDESVDISGQGKRVSMQPGGVAWVIYDQRLHEFCAGLYEYEELKSLGAPKSAETPAALAEQCGIDPGAFAATVAAVEAYAAGREADPLGRDFTLKPALTPPYWALRVTGALFHTQGGLQVDGGAQVLRPDGRPLPNLFAGGGAARSISGHGGSGYLPAAGLCMAVTLGRLAGRSAAALSGR